MSLHRAITDLAYRSPQDPVLPFYDLATRLRTEISDPIADDVRQGTLSTLVDLFSIPSYEDATRQAAGNLLLELVKHSASTRDVLISNGSIREPIVDTILQHNSRVLQAIAAAIVDHLQQYYNYTPPKFFPKHYEENGTQTFPSVSGSDWAQVFEGWAQKNSTENAEDDRVCGTFYAVGLKSNNEIPHHVHYDKDNKGKIMCVLTGEHLTCARITANLAKTSWFLNVPVSAIARSIPRQNHPVPSHGNYPKQKADQVSLEVDEEAIDIVYNGNTVRTSSIVLILDDEDDDESAKDISELFKFAFKKCDSQHDRRKSLRVSQSTTKFNCSTNPEPALPPLSEIGQTDTRRTDRGKDAAPSKQKKPRGLEEQPTAVPASQDEKEETTEHQPDDMEIVHDSHGQPETQHEPEPMDVVKQGASTEKGKAATKGDRPTNGTEKGLRGQSKLRHRMGEETNSEASPPKVDGQRPVTSKKGTGSKPTEDGETQLFLDTASGKKPSANKTYKSKANAKEKKVPLQQTLKSDTQALGKRKTRSSLLTDAGPFDELPPAKKSTTSKARTATAMDIYEGLSDGDDGAPDHAHQIDKGSSVKTEKASSKSQGSVGKPANQAKKPRASITGNAAAASKSVTQAGASSRKQQTDADAEATSNVLEQSRQKCTVNGNREDHDKSDAVISGMHKDETVPASTGKLRSVDKSVGKITRVSDGKIGAQGPDKSIHLSRASIDTEEVNAGNDNSTQKKPLASTKATKGSKKGPKKTSAGAQTAARSEKVPVIDLETPQPRARKPQVLQSASAAQLPDDSANRKAQFVSFSARGPRNQGSRSPRKAAAAAKETATGLQPSHEEVSDAERVGEAIGPDQVAEPSLEQSNKSTVTHAPEPAYNVAEEDDFGPAPDSSPPEDIYADRLGSQLSQRVSGEGSPHRKDLRLPVADIRGSIRSDGSSPDRPPPTKASQIKANAASVTQAPVETNLPPSRNPDNDIGRRTSLAATTPMPKPPEPHSKKDALASPATATETIKDAQELPFKKPARPALKVPAPTIVPSKPSSQAKPPVSNTIAAQTSRVQNVSKGSISQDSKAVERVMPIFKSTHGSKVASKDSVGPVAPTSATLQPSARAPSQLLNVSERVSKPMPTPVDRPEEAAHAAAKAAAISATTETIESPSREMLPKQTNARQKLKPRDLLAKPLHIAQDELSASASPSEVVQMAAPSSSAPDDAYEVSRPPAEGMSRTASPQRALAEVARSPVQPDEREHEPEPTPEPQRSLFADFIASKSNQPVAVPDQTMAFSGNSANPGDSDETLVEEQPDAIMSENEHVADGHGGVADIQGADEGVDAAEEEVRMSDHSSDSDARSTVSEHEYQTGYAEEPPPEPEDNPAFTAYREYMAWEEALDPHQKEYHDVFARISKQLISHILDTETSAISTISDYEKGGSALIRQLEESHAVETRIYETQLKQAGVKMRTSMLDVLAELDEGGRQAKETMREIRAWESGLTLESGKAVTELDRLIQIWG